MAKVRTPPSAFDYMKDAEIATRVALATKQAQFPMMAPACRSPQKRTLDADGRKDTLPSEWQGPLYNRVVSTSSTAVEQEMRGCFRVSGLRDSVFFGLLPHCETAGKRRRKICTDPQNEDSEC